MKNIILGITVLLLMVSVGYCQEQPLQLTIKSDKEVYGVGEDIYIDYQIVNTGNDDITLAPPFSDNGVIGPNQFGGTFIVKGEQWEIAKKIFPMAVINWAVITPGEVITIKKDASYTNKINIVRISEDSLISGIPYSSAKYLQKTGKYMITGKYEWSERLKDYHTPNCWRGELISNTITIEVVEKLISKEEPLKYPKYPESERTEEMQYKIVRSFYAPLNFVMTNVGVEQREVDPDEAIKEARIYLKKYPNGKHAVMIQRFIAFIYQYHKKDYIQAIKEFDKLIQNYPENESPVATARSEKARLLYKIRRGRSEKETTHLFGLDNTNESIVVKGNNEFALDLYKELKNEEGNLFFSPFSISTALAMTYAGARGNTATQMANVLHFDLAQDRLHPIFSQLIEHLYATPEESGYQLNIANSLWGQKDYKFLKKFLNLIDRSYGGGFYEVDFKNATEKTRQTINHWVEEKTQNKIKDILLPSDIDPVLTKLVLANAIYFKGNWMSKFKKEHTIDEPFKLATGKKVNVPMMKQKKKFNYTEDDTAQILEMPYVGDRLSMVILLPKAEDGIKQLEEKFTMENITHWLSKLHKQKVSISVPKFKTTSRFYLEEILSKMGMADAFSSSADFSGMTRSKILYIGPVIHKAFVDVNEEGTEAAAATIVRVRSISLDMSFKADHPFIFLIRDTYSGSILFIGRIMDPR